MLAHLGANDVDGDDPVTVDAIPDGWLESALYRRCGIGLSNPGFVKPKARLAPAAPIRKPRRDSGGTSLAP